jgi:long-chain acyl-CoA synthetase
MIKRRSKSLGEQQELSHEEGADRESVSGLMRLRTVAYGNRPAFYLKENNQWKKLTYAELSDKSAALTDYLIEQGLMPGQRVAILSESRPEWGIIFFAAISSGAVVVPLDGKLTPPELLSILLDSEPRVLFVSSKFAATALSFKPQVPSLEKIILIEEGATANGLLSFDILRASTVMEGRDRGLDETALIIYTSGTTGDPKGVMITFRNLLSQIEYFSQTMKLSPEETFLSILPLNHLLELTVGFLGVLYAGGRICYCHSLYPDEITQMMRERRVTQMITVPLFLSMLKRSVEREIGRQSGPKRRLFQVAFRLARFLPAHSWRRLLFHEIHQQFGGRLRAFISGGAPLEREVAKFFERLGLPVYQGYGLTETSPVISVNTPAHNRLGSVGRPLPGVRVRILKDGADSPEGEILTAGPHVMRGYYKREELTREVIDEEGWLHTGDLGLIDKDGFLYITGRSKNLIVLGSGKKVQPEEVENQLSKSPLIKEVCVMGRTGRQGLMEHSAEICAVIVPSDSVNGQLKEEEKAIEERIKKEVDSFAEALAPFKRPSTIFVSHQPLPRTATHKIKRSLVLQWLRSQHESQTD